jgi:hypothetical protein
MCYNIMAEASKINIVVVGKRIIRLHQHLKIQETSGLRNSFISFKDRDLQEFDSYCG